MENRAETGALGKRLDVSLGGQNLHQFGGGRECDGLGRLGGLGEADWAVDGVELCSAESLDA